MTNELDTLRPEVRAAMDEMDRIARIVPAQCSDELRIIRAELLRLAEGLHYANGVASLAMQHRDAAEAELAALRSQPFRGRAQDAIDRFAGGEELSHEEMCEIVNQAVCAERELAAFKNENAQLRDVLADRDMDREMAAHANKGLAALKARIAEAPIIHAEKTWRGTLFVNLSQHDVDLLDGKRVRLVVEE